MATSNFRVVDLDSQARAVARHVKGWPREQVLAWLALHGTVELALHGTPEHWRTDHYVFYSPYGPVTDFILTPTGDFFLMGDHTIIPVTPGG